MIYHMNIAQQIKRIIKNTKLFELPVENVENRTSSYKDITDGKIYKALLQSKIGALIQKQEAFTFIMNTDGIALAEKSNLSLWPIFLAINEIPVEERFCIDNMIVAGKK